MININIKIYIGGECKVSLYKNKKLGIIIQRERMRLGLTKEELTDRAEISIFPC